MNGIIDRVEGEIVVIEIDGVTQDYAKAIVDEGVKVGDVVEFIDGRWVTNEAETRNRSKKIRDLMDELWED